MQGLHPGVGLFSYINKCMTYTDQLKNIYTLEQLSEWCENLHNKSKYKKEIVSSSFHVSQCKYPTWIAITNKPDGFKVHYHTNNNISGALYHVLCEYCDSDKLPQLELENFKSVLYYFDTDRKKDFQRVLNYIKKFAK